MPAPVTSPSSTRTANKASTHQPSSPSRKRRIVRRRGRKASLGSDDEIERELHTDSESEDELSSLDSASDSDTEPASDGVIPNSHSRTFTPNTSHSSDRELANKEPQSFFAPTTDWSEMAAAETSDGPADLPIIDFANFDGQAAATASVPRPRKTKKPAKGARADSAPAIPVSQTPALPQPTEETSPETSDERSQPSASRRSASKSSFSGRLPGQSARQAYQQRLENDPSFVPIVGGFWGHDDRLLDKDLRSLSGWWRGRWQGRGRGGGSIRGRGRAGFAGSPGSHHNLELAGQPEEPLKYGRDVPPIDRQWTHDGFEEMKEKEDQRRTQREVQTNHVHATAGFRGTRGFGRGRGGLTRGSISSLGRAPLGRIWYQMKPELMWTKQHEGFLHFELDPALKPRQGQGIGIQIRLPGKPPKIVRARPRPWKGVLKISSAKSVASGGSDVGERVYAVRLPRNPEKSDEISLVAAQETLQDTAHVPLSSPTSKGPIALSQMDPIPRTSSALPGPSRASSPPVEPSFITLSAAQLKISSEPQSEQLPDMFGNRTGETAPKNISPTEVTEVSHASHLPEVDSSLHQSLPQVYTHTPPVSQSSPAYGSPYAYVPALPPGIALNQHGVPYELATGRPVYLPPGPPAPMFNPRPIMHSHVSSPSIQFMSNHVHPHSAVSPDFLSHSPSPHTPPMNGFIDPATGTPIFSFPRQTTRVKISAPGDVGVTVKSPTKPSPATANGASVLRNTASAFEPSARSPRDVSATTTTGGYLATMNGVTNTQDVRTSPIYLPVPVDGTGESGAASHHQQQHQHHHPQTHDTGVMSYQYPQHYYYHPDPYYNPFMDMSQVGQYEMYPSEGYTPQGAVFY